MDTLPKHAPHAFVHARPWDNFKGKQVGRKQVSRREVFIPGHKANASVEAGLTSSAAIGALAGGPARASAMDTSRRQFGAWAAIEEPRVADVLGPVDLSRERSEQGRTQARTGRASKLEEPPADTLRWNPEAVGGSVAGTRRREVNRILEMSEHPLQPSAPRSEEAAAKAAAARCKAANPPADTLRERPFRAPKAVQHEEKMRMRAMLEEEAKAQQAAAGRGAVGGSGVAGLSAGMTREQRMAAMADPRVQAAIEQAMNAPNAIAADNNRARNTTRVSAEKRW